MVMAPGRITTVAGNTVTSDEAWELFQLCVQNGSPVFAFAFHRMF